MHSRSSLWFLTALCLFLVGGSGSATEKQTLTRQLTLQPGGRLTIDNSRGDIRIVTWSRGRVALKAEKTGSSKDDMDLVPIAIDARDDAIHVTSVFPVYAPELDVRVDYRLRVPESIELRRLRCVRGEVEVSHARGLARIDVQNGDIKVKKFAGVLEATTLVGGIEAELIRLTPDDFVKLEAFSGDISLTVPKRTKAHWVVRSMNGAIESEIPFEIRGQFGPEVVHEPSGVDAPIVRAESVMGNIRIDVK